MVAFQCSAGSKKMLGVFTGKTWTATRLLIQTGTMPYLRLESTEGRNRPLNAAALHPRQEKNHGEHKIKRNVWMMFRRGSRECKNYPRVPRRSDAVSALCVTVHRQSLCTESVEEDSSGSWRYEDPGHEFPGWWDCSASGAHFQSNGVCAWFGCLGPGVWLLTVSELGFEPLSLGFGVCGLGFERFEFGLWGLAVYGFERSGFWG